jgi:hypothetical protein
MSAGGFEPARSTLIEGKNEGRKGGRLVAAQGGRNRGGRLVAAQGGRNR